MKFNSQICTSREQSERLLALGLKKETADMWYPHFAKTCPLPLVDEVLNSDDLPAWSLHRLIKLAYGNWDEDIVPIYLGNAYDMLIERIEFQVKQGKFNKEYLV